ncbi:serine/threonine protein kinase, CMGC, CDC2/CDK sub [Scheffersomyces spartinae]|uniref:Serine/threonine-protein kinase BUR1 n=1 Tax=Scheffersomyces spartinae TaxID=45513 RepID=A0A9P8AJH0_9ASCO|nr:serine/threonine protein kinase, CMGC, CDC2/CDK sub [Scheffersomyces spartinae]KAG7194864.1 serine/threonine protein kinase, CMGC, CDC2/CDK sub [Scheffersomyces spartinae]
MPESGTDHGSLITSISQIPTMNTLKNYEIQRKLGQGTFGMVQMAVNKKTRNKVALKQLLNHLAKEGFPVTAMREITILRRLHNKNILTIVDMIYEEPKVDNPKDLIHQRGCFYTVSPYMSCDLVGIFENPRIHLNIPQIKCLMLQLLSGMDYIHSQRFLHRDVKAANILIDDQGVLKIADFGLARVYHGSTPKLGKGPGGGERNYTGLVVTRWYRPPELLLGERQYTTAVDMWGVGCVFGEFFIRKPILPGQSDAHQAQLVFSLVGPPNNDKWTSAVNLPNKQDYSIGLTCKRTLEQRFMEYLSQDGLDLLSGLLTLDPYKRLNAQDAMKHLFFTELPLPLKPSELPKFEECHEIDREKFKKMKELGPSNIGQPNNNTINNYNNHNSSGASFLSRDNRADIPSKSISHNHKDAKDGAQGIRSSLPTGPRGKSQSNLPISSGYRSGRAPTNDGSEKSNNMSWGRPSNDKDKSRSSAATNSSKAASFLFSSRDRRPPSGLKTARPKSSSTAYVSTLKPNASLPGVKRPRSESPLEVNRVKRAHDMLNESDLTDFEDDVDQERLLNFLV